PEGWESDSPGPGSMGTAAVSVTSTGRESKEPTSRVTRTVTRAVGPSSARSTSAASGATECATSRACSGSSPRASARAPTRAASAQANCVPAAAIIPRATAKSRSRDGSTIAVSMVTVPRSRSRVECIDHEFGEDLADGAAGEDDVEDPGEGDGSDCSQRVFGRAHPQVGNGTGGPGQETGQR